MTLLLSPLDAIHRAAGARMVAFGGWEMPLDYASTLAEHIACRTDAVVFDVSHLGTVRCEGVGAFEAIQGALTNDLERIGPGRAQYTHLLDEQGGVVDDIIVWWRTGAAADGGPIFDLMPNASNTDAVCAAVGGRDVTHERAVLAVQGPTARACLAQFWPKAAGVGRFRVEDLEWDGASCVVAGTGYTGEDGVEIALPVERAPQLWEQLSVAGVRPAGLGARDTLRLEAGLPLHGQELGPEITPLQAGLAWVVAMDKPAFRGRNAILAERAAGPTRRLRGIMLAGRRPARTGYVVSWNGRPCGTVTSGNFSPVLGHSIALALLEVDVPEGAEVTVDLRGATGEGRVVAPPFVPLGGRRSA